MKNDTQQTQVFRMSPIWAGVVLAAVAGGCVVGNLDWSAPPRFDGAGYAMLGLALSQGEGYREIGHPDQAPHDHFPPGYPMVLGITWRVCGGPSVRVAHAENALFVVLAVLVTWRWFRTILTPTDAWLSALIVATNWTWSRAGGSIQSEPLFLLMSMTAMLWFQSRAYPEVGSGSAWRCAVRGLFGGGLLGWCILTRQVGVALAAAAGVHIARLGWMRRDRIGMWMWETLGVAAGLCVWVGPWIAWTVMTNRRPQAALAGGDAPLTLIGEQLLFYARRLPDLLFGPWIEVATVFRNDPLTAGVATAIGGAVSGVMVIGWIARALRPVGNLGGLAPLATMGVLLLWPFTEAGRFLIPLVPFAVLGFVEGATVLASTLQRRRAPRPQDQMQRLVLVLMFAAALPYPVWSLARDRAGAQRALQADYDAACAWLKTAPRTGPIVARHPGDVFWLTGRQALSPIRNDDKHNSDDAEAAREWERLFQRYGVSYLLDDQARYARSEPSPLHTWILDHADRVRPVGPNEAAGSVRIYELPPRD